VHDDTELPPVVGAAVVEVADVVLASVLDDELDVLDTDVVDVDALAVDLVAVDVDDGWSFAVWSLLQAAMASTATDTVTTARHDIAPITPPSYCPDRACQPPGFSAAISGLVLGR
jgi:hypothetical protein